jgi:replicative DNA helicase
MHLLEKAGGESYLGQMLKDSPATTANIEAYAERVREFSVLRQLISASGDIANVAYHAQGSIGHQHS